MNLKFYLRGLGIGIVVTALLLSLSSRNPSELTDEEIKARAAELGMVEQKVLSDISTPEPEVKPTEEPIAESTDKPTTEPTQAPEEDLEVTVTQAPEEDPEVTVTQAPEEDLEVTVTQAPQEPSEQSEVIILTIKSGETSWSISEALYEAGVVESVADFDAYLCQNGYDKTIRTGTFEISTSATYEEIAKKIAR